MSALCFVCPLCEGEPGTIRADTFDLLNLKIAAHITNQHEDPAAMRALARARLNCRNENCGTGTERVLNFKSKEWEYRLTDYDHAYLKGINVRWD